MSALPDEARQEAVVLLDADPELTNAVPQADRDLARRTLTVPRIELDPGAVDVDALELPAGTFALVVVEGDLRSDVVLHGRSLTEFLRARDVIPPWGPDVDALPATRELTAVTPSAVAVLETRFVMSSARWPGLMVALNRRMADQRHRLAVHGAICQLPRVEDRIAAFLRHLSERVGHVTAEGTVVPMKLTHQELGGLIGARRPTVSLAIRELVTTGRLGRTADGAWVLPHEDPVING